MSVQTEIETRPVLWGALRLPVHPIYERDMRNVWGLRKGIWRYTLVVHGIVLLVFGGLVGLGVWVSYLDFQSYSVSTPWWEALALMLSVGIYGLLLVIGLADLIFEIAALVLSVNLVNRELVAGRLDLLRLAAGSEKTLIAAKYGLARARSWRFLAVGLALRGIVVVLLIVAGVASFIGVIIAGEEIGFRFIDWWLWIIAVVVSVGVLYIEPFWRMDMLTSLGLTLSARIRQHNTAILAALGSWLGLGVLRQTALSCLSAPFIAVSIIFTEALSDVDTATAERIYEFLLFYGFPALILIITALTYGFYWLMRRWFLGSAATYLQKRDPVTEA